MGFLNNDKLIVGYDLGNKYCQISYALSEGREPETLSQVAGAQNTGRTNGCTAERLCAAPTDRKEFWWRTWYRLPWTGRP